MSKFSLFKKAAIPALTILLSQNVMAQLMEIKCESYDARYSMEFFNTDFKDGSDYISLRMLKVDSNEYYAGSGSIAGNGKVQGDKLNFDLTWRDTGSSTSSPIAKLEGKKVNGEWKFTLTPKSTNKKIALDSCNSHIFK